MTRRISSTLQKCLAALRGEKVQLPGGESLPRQEAYDTCVAAVRDGETSLRGGGRLTQMQVVRGCLASLKGKNAGLSPVAATNILLEGFQPSAMRGIGAARAKGDEVLDLFQNTVIKFLHAAKKGKLRPTALGGWFYVVGFRQAKSHQRKKRPGSAEAEQLNGLAARNHVSEAQMKKDFDDLLNAINCTREQRRLLYDRFFRGKKFREIARKEGVSLATVTGMYNRLLKQLGKRL
jgi:RNA polymerase sigma factor (sigma-70 family)